MGSLSSGNFVSKAVPAHPDVTAPDGSLIRLLPSLRGGSMCHCTLPPGGVSKAVTHKTVEEIWYCVRGRGQIWRRRGDQEEEVDLTPGVSITIPLGTHFQFRTVGGEDLGVIIVTMPPWPGADEAVPVPDHWPATVQPAG
jgi:mannose-6-phosphate isomerase-like protein (cupin superfamily)